MLFSATPDVIDNCKSIIRRMRETDDYIVRGMGNYFWANNNHRGCLIEACTGEEIYAVQRLSVEHPDIIKHETKRWYI